MMKEFSVLARAESACCPPEGSLTVTRVPTRPGRLLDDQCAPDSARLRQGRRAIAGRTVSPEPVSAQWEKSH